MLNKTALFTSLALTATLSTFAAAEDNRPYLTTTKAMKGLQACQALAGENNWNMAVVIVDRGEDIKVSMRMDNALPAAYTGATLKAITALSWSMPTHKVAEIAEKKPEFKLFPGIFPIGGGEPIFSESGKLIGAIGVAGGYVEHDQACAKAAVEAIKAS